MKKVATPKGAIAYQIFGEGPPLVMLRGLGRTMRHWVGFDREMAKHFRVVLMDLRGMGETERIHGVLDNVWDYADDLALVMDDAELPDAHVMGVSLGGMATLAMGLRYPERTKSLILVNSSIGGYGLPRLTIEATKFIVQGSFMRDEKLHANLVDLLVGRECPPERRSEIAQAYAEIAQEQGLFIETVGKQLIAAVRFKPGPALQDLKVPTLIVYGTDDRFVPLENSQNLANVIPGAQLVVIPGAGHEVSADKGPELEAVIQAWVAELPR